MTLRPANAARFVFGRVTDSVLTIRNESDRAVAVLGVFPADNPGEEPVRLVGPAYGSISRLPDGAYEYDTLPQRATGKAFHNGFLLPGQEVRVALGYRPLEKVERFSIARLSSAAAYDGTLPSLAPLAVYLPAGGDGMKTLFRPFGVKEWRALYADESAVPPAIGPGITTRSVIIDGGETGTVDVTVSFAFEKGGFFMNEAKKAAARITGQSSDRLVLCYSTTLGGYLVREGGASWVLASAGQARRGDALPAVPPSLLKDADTNTALTFRVGDRQEGFGPGPHPASRRFWDRYPIRYGDGMYTRGEFIDVPASGLPVFLGLARRRGMAIETRSHYFNSRYYEIIEIPPRGGSEKENSSR